MLFVFVVRLMYQVMGICLFIHYLCLWCMIGSTAYFLLYKVHCRNERKYPLKETKQLPNQQSHVLHCLQDVLALHSPYQLISCMKCQKFEMLLSQSHNQVLYYTTTSLTACQQQTQVNKN